MVRIVNAYFTVVLTAIALFFLVWALGWLLEKLSHQLLGTVSKIGSKAWYLLVGPGVALHESSHGLGCILTGTPIVEFKPVNVEVTDEGVVLGYVKYRRPTSAIKNAVINLAPVVVSLVLLIFFALGATYFVPGSPGIGGEALDLLADLIEMRSNPSLLNDAGYPVAQIVNFVYLFLYTFAGLTVLSPVFWIVAFLAMTIMFSNAPSDVDIRNARAGLRAIIVFDTIWLIIAYFIPQAGMLLYGLFEFLAVMWALALAFAAVGYGFFILVFALSRLRTPLQAIPLALCLASAFVMAYSGFGTAAFQTIAAVGLLFISTTVMLAVKSFRVGGTEA
ncbi:hypothetical protein EU538_03360 [Candidatus Thorarchaeota archaeon]|nr:MAG: hypothetical protein EU538_03360 [Candidatus Thorarchaeota archaeon]